QRRLTAFPCHRAPGAEAIARPGVGDKAGRRDAPHPARERDPQRDLEGILLRRDRAAPRRVGGHGAHLPQAHLPQARGPLENGSRVRGEPPRLDSMRALAIAAGLTLVLAAHPAVAQDTEIVIEEADFILSNAWRAPPRSAPWQRVKLPDNWYLTPPEGGVGWSRLTFELPARESKVSHSFYLPRNSAARIFFFVGDGWRASSRFYGDPGSANWAPPL